MEQDHGGDSNGQAARRSPVWVSGTLAVRVAAGPDAAATARQGLRCWLCDHAVHPDLVNDVILAASELVDNATAHAYPAARPGPVDLDARLDHDITLTVADHGSWEPWSGPASAHRGLAMVTAVADSVDIDHSTRGTRVRATFAGRRQTTG
jgi:serine/threonine-protein kinase RsbW